jgi:hypothetical protein
MHRGLALPQETAAAHRLPGIARADKSRMILTIDNLDGVGVRDYSGFVDGEHLPKIARKYNQPAEMQAWLAGANDLPAPMLGARVELRRRDGAALFTGYLSQAPQWELLGAGEAGPISRLLLNAVGEEYVLDRQVLPARAPIVGRCGGDILKALTSELASGVFDMTAVASMEMLSPFSVDPESSWSKHAAQLGVLCRAAYRIHDRKLIFKPVGSQNVAVSESDDAMLTLQQPHGVVNDITILGDSEPQRYVKDYFQGNGASYWFTLSQSPYAGASGTLLVEDYMGALAPQVWNVVDPAQSILPAGGSLAVSGGTGVDGQTYVAMAENLELAGAVVLQHGEFSFTAPSRGIAGGLYSGGVSAATCLAGFSITQNGNNSTIQALVNGVATGPAVTTTNGHRYVLVTRLYCVEPFRTSQLFHSGLHPSGAGVGGTTIAADLNVVMELREIDPSNPASMLAAPTVLFDGRITNAPAFATYAVVDAVDLHCTLGYTQIDRTAAAEVRVTPNGSTVSSSKIIGEKIDGAACEITTGGSPEVVFYSYSMPANGDAIVVRYRGGGTSEGRVQSTGSIAGLACAGDTGVRGAVVRLELPPARSSDECRGAATTLLEDTTATAWSGQYQCWSDSLQGVQDVWPGDAIEIALPQSSQVTAIVREVKIQFLGMGEQCSQYTIEFSNDAAQQLGFALGTTKRKPALSYSTEIAGASVPCLPSAEITSIQYASVVIDAGMAPVAGGGFEVRLKDEGWGANVDRNLLGRFTTETFTVIKMATSQDYFLRMFDGSMPPNYSRFATLLHADY